MNLFSLYREHAAAVVAWKSAAHSAETEPAREHFSFRALRSVEIAACLAHCCAAFGDIDVKPDDLDRLREKARQLGSSSYNPWEKGLGLIDDSFRGLPSLST